MTKGKPYGFNFALLVSTTIGVEGVGGGDKWLTLLCRAYSGGNLLELIIEKVLYRG